MAFDPTSILEAPFKLHGRDPSTGVDCRWVVEEFHRQEGNGDFDLLADATTPSLADLPGIAGTRWQAVAAPYRRGDVLVYRNSDGAPHCAVFLGGHDVIHATYEAGVIVSRLSDIRQTLLAAYRLCHGSS